MKAIKETKIIIGLVLAIVLISGCAEPTPPATTPTTTINGVSGKTVDIKGFVFNPDTITISKGTTVTWTNKDSASHTITGDNFDSGPISQDKTFSQTFEDMGTFEYHCTVHTAMIGTVIVK